MIHRYDKVFSLGMIFIDFYLVGCYFFIIIFLLLHRIHIIFEFIVKLFPEVKCPVCSLINSLNVCSSNPLSIHTYHSSENFFNERPIHPQSKIYLFVITSSMHAHNSVLPPKLVDHEWCPTFSSISGYLIQHNVFLDVKKISSAAKHPMHLVNFFGCLFYLLLQRCLSFPFIFFL